MDSVPVAEDKSKRAEREVEKVVGWAISHRTRVEILIVLQQGIYCVSELAEILDLPVNTVSSHVTKMAQGGAIEIAESRRVRNFYQHYYRAVSQSEYTSDDLRAMHPVSRQVVVSFAAQSLLAEILAALWTRKISRDPNHMMVWNRLNLDDEGRREITEEQEQHWNRLQEIEEKSLVRAAREKEDTTPYIVATLGFERGRKAPRPRTSAFAE